MVRAWGRRSRGAAYFLKNRRYRLGGFHLVALFCIIAAVASCSASLYGQDALFKVFSFSLLFLYAASGMRGGCAMEGATVLSRIVVILRTSDLPIGGLLFRIALRLFWKPELPGCGNGRPGRFP